MHLFFEGSTVGRTRFADAPSNILRNTFNLIYHYNSKNKYRQTLSTFYISIYRPLFLKISKKLIYLKTNWTVQTSSLTRTKHRNQRFGSGSGSTSIPASNPLRFLSSDPDPLQKALIWIRVTPKLFRVKSKTKCFCYLRNAFSKFWR